MEKCCFFLSLRRGMIILGIFDIFLLAGVTTGILCVFEPDFAYAVLGVLIYLVAIILVLVSVCTLKKELIIPYMVSAILRMIELIFWMGWGIEKGHTLFSLFFIFVIIARVYLWICAFSWYKELENS